MRLLLAMLGMAALVSITAGPPTVAAPSAFAEKNIPYTLIMSASVGALSAASLYLTFSYMAKILNRPEADPLSTANRLCVTLRRKPMGMAGFAHAGILMWAVFTNSQHLRKSSNNAVDILSYVVKAALVYVGARAGVHTGVAWMCSSGSKEAPTWLVLLAVSTLAGIGGTIGLFVW